MAHQIAGPLDACDSDGRPALKRLGRRAVLIAFLQAAATLVACTVPLPQPPATSAPSPANDQSLRTTPDGARITPIQVPRCARNLPAIVPPTPIPYPGYAQQEPETGLHVTSGALSVDLTTYRLLVSGLINQPLSLSYDDLRCLPKVEAEVKLECPGYFVDQARLAGPTLASVLALAAPQPAASRVTLTSVDGYSTAYRLDQVQGEENFLAYEWRGEPLPASHGFPLRAALPGKPGSAWVKWLEEIRLS